MDLLTWLQTNMVWVLAFIVALDNALAQIPMLDSNSTFQLVSNWIKSIASMLSSK